ncbi:hypothetical protein ACOTDD_30310 [Achromobacter xylosoxidans]
MTNSYDVDHGLSQCPPGPLEPVELAQQPGAAPATGNTEKEQEMYAAGIRTGEENAKNNAAIRGAWLPIESAPKDSFIFDGLHHYGTKIIVFDGSINTARWWRIEGDSSSNFIDEGGRAIYPTHWMPLPAAPGAPASPVSTVEDERQPDACPHCDGTGTITVMSDSSPDAHDMDVCCDHCQGSGAAVDAAKYLAAALAGEKYRHMQLYSEYKNFHRSLCARFGYGHDEVHFRRDLVSLEEAIAAMRPAPAAGDALAWQGLTDAERDGYVGELVDYGTDFVAPLYSVVESIEKRLREKNAALAAQVPQQGEA